MVIILYAVNPKDIGCDICKKSKICLNYEISSYSYNKYLHVIKKDMTRILSKLMEEFPKAKISFVNHYKIIDLYSVIRKKELDYQVNTINFEDHLNWTIKKINRMIDEYASASSINHYIGIRIKGKGYTLKFNDIRNLVLDAIKANESFGVITR